jgi:predicted DNA-binding transcriptional regulator AlpA
MPLQWSIVMLEDRLLVDWKALKALGWPYSRTHTWRLIDKGAFPRPLKFGDHPKSRVAWYWRDIEEYLKVHQYKTHTTMCKF